jgi:hypothetical protein
MKLTDGITGTPNPGDSTWVGLEYADSGAAQVTFSFAAPVTITGVSIDFLRDDQANTQLPEGVTIDGTSFSVTDFSTDQTQGFVNFTGSWTGSDLVLTMDHTEDPSAQSVADCSMTKSSRRAKKQRFSNTGVSACPGWAVGPRNGMKARWVGQLD